MELKFGDPPDNVQTRVFIYSDSSPGPDESPSSCFSPGAVDDTNSDDFERLRAARAAALAVAGRGGGAPDTLQPLGGCVKRDVRRTSRCTRYAC